MLAVAVPEEALIEKVSPMPLIAPPPLGTVMDGKFPEELGPVGVVEVDFEVAVRLGAVVRDFVFERSAIACFHCVFHPEECNLKKISRSTTHG
jgi:hypothetical protein